MPWRAKSCLPWYSSRSMDSSDQALGQRCAMRVGALEQLPHDLLVVLAEQRRPGDFDGGGRQVERAADGLERPAFGVVALDDHPARHEIRVLEQLALIEDGAARDVD